MPKINTYLNFPGNTEEAFNFYKSSLGGDFSSLVRFKDMPVPGQNLSKEDENRIMHIALPVGNDVLMATDAPPSMGFSVTFGNHSYISIQADSKQEADRLFNGLSAGGEVEMAMGDQPWGDYFGSFRDRYGVGWMISYSSPR